MDGGRNGAVKRAVAHENYPFTRADDHRTVIKRREDYDDGSKSFFWPKGNSPRDMLLYNYELLAEHREKRPGEWVIFGEGEKTADAAVRCGFTAVSLAGSGSQRDFGVALDDLKGLKVALCPDRMDGEPLMLELVNALADTAEALCWVDMPPEVKKKGKEDKGTDFADLLQHVQGDEQAARKWMLSLIEQAPTPTPKPKPRPSTAVDVHIYTDIELSQLTFPPKKQIVPGLLDAEHYLLSGSPKIGKSFLLMTLATAIAYGGYALGSIKVDPRPVLYLALEDGLRRTTSRFMARMSDQTLTGQLNFAFTWPKTDDGGLDLMHDWLIGHHDGVVLIDTGKRIRGGNGSDPGASFYSNDYDFIYPITDLAHEFDTMIVTIWHDRKLEAEDFFDQVNASRGLTAGVDGVCQLSRQRGEREGRLVIGDRDSEERAFRLRWDEQLSGWLMLGPTDLAPPKPSNDQVILAFLQSHKQREGHSAEEIADATGINIGSVRNGLGRLKDQKEVINNVANYRGKWYATRGAPLHTVE